jgi:cell division protein FtsQ
MKAAARRRPPVPPLPDRPSRMRLLWRRQRRRLRPGLALLALLAVGLGGLLGLQAMGQGESLAERFGDATARLGLRVRQVIVEGRQKTPEPLLRAAIGVEPGDPLLSVSLRATRQRIETIQWVRQAEVERRLPDTIVVRLVERRPFAVWQHDGRFVLIDRDGKMVTDSDVATFATQVPLVVGLGAPDAAAALIDALSAQPGIFARVVAAVRVGERRWNLRMKNGADILLPEDGEVAALARLAMLQTTHAVLDRPVSIDLRQPDRVVFRPLPGAAVPSAETRDPQARRPT